MEFQSVASDIFSKEIMPLITEGMMSGFDCHFIGKVLDLGEKHLADLLAKFGMDWAASAVDSALEMILSKFGVARCQSESLAVADNLENALY